VPTRSRHAGIEQHVRSGATTPLNLSWRSLAAILLLPLLFSVGTRGAAPPGPPVAPEVVAVMKGLKGADAAKRQATYDLVGAKGDARLIPALTAYRDGGLQLRDDRLCIYGPRVTVPDKGSVLPLVDAITGEPIVGADGSPLYFARPDLSKAIRSPPRSERATLNDLISTLSLLDPDPTARIASIRDVAERSSRAFIDPVDQRRFARRMADTKAVLQSAASATPPPVYAAELRKGATAIDAALAQKPAHLTDAVPDAAATDGLATLFAGLTATVAADPAAAPSLTAALNDAGNAARDYQDRLATHQKVLDELPRYSASLHRQVAAGPAGEFVKPLTEAVACTDAVLGTRAEQLSAVKTLGGIGTERADLMLHRVTDAAEFTGDAEMLAAATPPMRAADRYQTEVHLIQDTFAGLSAGSILVLLALGLSIVFGLMGVINMAHGEFMMVGAFTTYVVSHWFSAHMPGWYDYYPVIAVPAAFVVSGALGFVCELIVIRHLYGRPLDTLLATWGLGLVLVQAVRVGFGDSVSVRPPSWMEGGIEVAPDLVFPLNRLYIILFCGLCIVAVYWIVNRTKLGLLLRATTQNREMAAALGVATRRVDGFTFALGCGLAGLAGVVVPLYNKINPNIGQEYIVDSFMVVVVGGVGKLAGAIVAGFSLGFISKYLEPIFQAIPALASGASVIGRVVVLGLVIIFLQWKPSGLFPPKGRMADG
jgi:urea transport system permease protein